MAAAKAKGRVALIYLESPANPTNALVDVEAVARRPRRRLRRRASCRRSRSTTPSSGRCGPSRSTRAPTSSVYSLTKYAGGHSDLVAGGAGRRQGADRQGADDAQHDGRHLRPQHRLDAAAQPRDARTAHEPRRRECGQGVRLPARPSQGREGRLSRLPRGRLAPGRHLQPPLHRRRLDLLALSEGRRDGGVRASSTRSRSPISRSASAAPRRSPARPRR